MLRVDRQAFVSITVMLKNSHGQWNLFLYSMKNINLQQLSLWSFNFLLSTVVGTFDFRCLFLSFPFYIQCLPSQEIPPYLATFHCFSTRHIYSCFLHLFCRAGFRRHDIARKPVPDMSSQRRKDERTVSTVWYNEQRYQKGSCVYLHYFLITWSICSLELKKLLGFCTNIFL